MGSLGKKGVTPIVGAILVIGLFLLVFTVSYPFYYGGIVEKEEAEHMREVRGALLELQGMLIGISGGSSVDVSLRMTGDDSLYTVIKHGKLGSLKFEARNSYLPDKIFAIEGGGLIEKEGEKVFMSSFPDFISAWDLLEDDQVRWVRVDVNYIVIENYTFCSSWLGTKRLRLICTSSTNRVIPKDNRPNRKNVTLSLRENIESGHENAWASYLITTAGRLRMKGYDVELADDNLGLIIHGFHENLKDIYYFEKVTKVIAEVG